MVTVSARWARYSDIGFLQTSGHVHLPEATLRRKIEGSEVAVAMSGDGALVGYVILDYLWSRYPFIAMIQVLEEHRRTGAGRVLLAFIEAEARTSGQTILYSSSQLDEPEAQAWHRHMGFEECGILNGHNDGIGEVFFRKQL